MIRMNYRDLGIEGTPTIALADSSGVVKEIWHGRLSRRREALVKQTLGLAAHSWYIEESEVDELRKVGQTVVVVDVQSRDLYEINHFKGAKNIPADEIDVRGVNELSLDDTIVVYGISEKDGEYAQETLLKSGFGKVQILNYKFQKPNGPAYVGN
jgi:rhodanese-related sulfurtransferase